MSICRVGDLKEALNYLQGSGLQIIVCHEKEGVSPYVINLRLPVVLLFGAESNGIHPNYLKLADQQVKIPMVGTIASLNVSVAAAIMMYECVRQRSF